MNFHFVTTPLGKFACGPTTKPTFRIHFFENKYEIAISRLSAYIYLFCNRP